MKRLKKLAALALAAVMVLGILNPVFAAGGGDASTSGSTGGTGSTTENTPPVADTQTGMEGSITIKEPQANSVYTAYQIFATITNGSNFAYIVEDGSIWEAFVKDTTDAGGAKFVTIDTASGKMTVTYREWGSAVLGPPNQGNQSVLSLLDLDQAGGDDGGAAPDESFYNNNVVTGYMVKWKEYTDATEANREADAAEFARRAMAYYSAHKDDKAESGLLETDIKWRGRSGSVSTEMILDQGQAESRMQPPLMGDNSVTIDGLPYGYYLVDSTTGALCSLNTAAPAAEIEDKNAPKKLIKQVWNGDGAPTWNEPLDNSGWTQGIDANVTDHLYFRTVFYPGQGQENLVLKDLVSGRMTVNPDSIQIVDSKGITLTEGNDYRVFWGTENDDYRAVTNSTNENKYITMALMNRIEYTLYNYWTFGIIFSNETIRNYTKEDTITVRYEATMDKNAYLVQYGDASGTGLNDMGFVADYVADHDNTAILGSAGRTTSEFDALVKSTNSADKLPWYKGTEGAEDKLPGILETGEIQGLNEFHADVLVSSASVNVSGFSVVKTDLKGKLLTGAKFALYYDEACNQAVPLSLTKYKRTEPGTYTVGEGADAVKVGLAPERKIYSYTNSSEGSNEIDITDTGTAAIVGLKAGVYYLKEIQAPAGYNALEKPQKITLLSFWDYLENNNLTGADSNITDTDMADDMPGLAQDNVLPQAGQSMLAQSRAIEKLSSGSQINHAVDNAADLAAGEAMRSRLSALRSAWINLAPIQVNDTGDINLKNYGWNDERHVNSARSFFNRVEENGEEVWYYGHTDGYKMQIGPNEQVLEGTEESPLCGGVRIINMTGIELPHTGGIGTTIFYVVGGLLVVGAGVLLIVKKRMKDEE